MTRSDLETIRGLRSWRLVTVSLSLFIFNMLLMASLILPQSAQPDLSLTPIIIAHFGLAAVLLLLNLGCVLALMPYTSDYIAGSSGRPNPGRMSRLGPRPFTTWEPPCGPAGCGGHADPARTAHGRDRRGSGAGGVVGTRARATLTYPPRFAT